MDSIRKQPPLAHMDDYDDLKLPTTSSKQNCKEMHCHVILNGDDHNDVEEAAGLTSNELIQLKKRKSLFMRLWKYLKHSLTGVIAGNEPVIEELELPHRYRPENLNLLCETTGFTEDEMKRIYRGFKTECPTGLITEEAFQGIYSRFFPHGAPFTWTDPNGTKRCSLKPLNNKLTKKEKREILLQQTNFNSYSHYVFSTLDQGDSGIITFEDFVLGLSILVKGNLEDKLRWMFALYDQDKDGYISRDEMVEVVASVFDLMGKTADPQMEELLIHQRVDDMFQVMDLNGDGLVSLDEFMEVCLADEKYCQSISVFCSAII